MYKFKARWNWLNQHPEERIRLGGSKVPHRPTVSRPYKALYSVIQVFIALMGQDSEALGVAMSRKHLNEDQSLFKAQGTVCIRVSVSKGVSLRT